MLHLIPVRRIQIKEFVAKAFLVCRSLDNIYVDEKKNNNNNQLNSLIKFLFFINRFLVSQTNFEFIISFSQEEKMCSKENIIIAVYPGAD